MNVGKYEYRVLAVIAIVWAIASAALALFGHAFEAIPVALVAVVFAILNLADE